MNCIDFGYSLKNVPLPSKDSYKYKLIENTEQLLKRMRWKAFFYDRDNTSKYNNKNNTYIDQTTDNGFKLKTRNCPLQMQDMKDFENDLLKLIENIQFRTVSGKFLNKLNEDNNKIRSSDKLFVSADKTQNYYEITKENYNKILYDNITKTYKKAQPSLPKKINVEAKKIAKSFSIDNNKMDITAKRKCFVTSKDHKDNFRVNPKYRLLNPTKRELDKISKHILQQISTNIRTALNVNQWENTSKVNKWFQNIIHTFAIFDIQEFYPSIGEKVLEDAVLFAQTHANISRKDIEVIFHCRRSLLFHNNEPWIKKDSNGDFDVTMGSYDGAELCELAELFMLNELSKKFDKDNIGLYRDHGLSVFKNYNGHQNDKVWKEMIDLFKHLVT